MNGVLLFLALQSAGRVPPPAGPVPLMSGLNIPKACSMALSMLSERLSRVEAYCPVDSGSGNSCGLLKSCSKALAGKLLAQTGTVIYLTVPVVYEGHAVDTAFLVFPEHHVNALFPEQPDEIFRFPRQLCMAQRDGIMDFRLPLPVPEISDIDGNPFFLSLRSRSACR